MGAASALFATLQAPHKVGHCPIEIFHTARYGLMIFQTFCQVSGLILVRLPTAWEEREGRKPQLEAAAKGRVRNIFLSNYLTKTINTLFWDFV